MVPMGQKVHQVLGLNRAITTRPMMVEVSIIYGFPDEVESRGNDEMLL